MARYAPFLVDVAAAPAESESPVVRPAPRLQSHGWTPTDLVFPFFLFIVGITRTLSLGGLLDGGVGPGSSSGRS